MYIWHLLLALLGVVRLLRSHLMQHLQVLRTVVLLLLFVVLLTRCTR